MTQLASGSCIVVHHMWWRVVCLRMHVVQGESVGVLTSLELVIEILLELAQFDVLPPDEGATATT